MARPPECTVEDHQDHPVGNPSKECYLAFEALPYRLLPNDEYEEDEPLIYSAMGTTCYQILYPRSGVGRLVASRPRNPPRKRVARKIQWPDAHDAKGLTAFCQKRLTSRRSNLESYSPMPDYNLFWDAIKSLHTFDARAALSHAPPFWRPDSPNVTVRAPGVDNPL